MIYFNLFHKEVTERKKQKIAASQQSPMNSSDFAQYMKHNLELAMSCRSKSRCEPASADLHTEKLKQDEFL